MASNPQVKVIVDRKQQLINEARQLADRLEKFYTAVRELRATEEDLNGAAEILVIPLCKVTQMIVRDLGKVGENVYAHKNADKGLRVVDTKHGADLINDETGEKMELKTTTYLPSKPLRVANFCFPVGPLSLGALERRAHMVRELEDKVRGLGICMEVLDFKGDTLREYKLSHLFSIEFFKRVPIYEKTLSYSISTAMCQTCSTMHRPNKLAYYSSVFDRQGNLTQQQWDIVFEKTVRQCRGARLDKEW